MAADLREKPYTSASGIESVAAHKYRRMWALITISMHNRVKHAPLSSWQSKQLRLQGVCDQRAAYGFRAANSLSILKNKGWKFSF